MNSGRVSVRLTQEGAPSFQTLTLLNVINQCSMHLMFCGVTVYVAPVRCIVGSEKAHSCFDKLNGGKLCMNRPVSGVNIIIHLVVGPFHEPVVDMMRFQLQ